jgi:DNA-directed RNA polymerase subunit RPC12/RpoP
VAARMCPHCGKTVPATRVIALSDGMECPHCQTRLEVGNGSRMIATAVGLGVAWIVWRVTRDSTNILGFALPVLLSFLAFGIVSPLVLMFTASLRAAPSPPVFEPVAAHGGHAQSVHDHAGGHH